MSKFPPACLCDTPHRGKTPLRCPVHTASTLTRKIAVKDDLVRMMLPLGNRAKIYLEDECGNFIFATAELVEDQGPLGPAFLVIKPRR